MIGINGFGRIGRLVLRASVQGNTPVKVGAINDPFMDTNYLIYQLKYDSAHLRFQHAVEKWDQGIIVMGQKIKVTHFKTIPELDWSSTPIVIDCTGINLQAAKAGEHLKRGAKKVVMSAPAKDETKTFVFGVNHTLLKADDHIVSNASCTTNCLAPIAKVIHDRWKITEGLMTTVHSATATQQVVDSASKGGKDWRAGRAASVNIIPSSTGAAKAVGKVLPDLKGKLTGMAFRVPTVNVSAVDLTFKTEKECTYEDICKAMKQASEGAMKGVLGYTNQEVASSDFMHDSHSSIFDEKAGISLNKNFHKVVSWYDNEWGYSNRLLDLSAYIKTVSGL